MKAFAVASLIFVLHGNLAHAKCDQLIALNVSAQTLSAEGCLGHGGAAPKVDICVQLRNLNVGPAELSAKGCIGQVVASGKACEMTFQFAQYIDKRPSAEYEVNYISQVDVDVPGAASFSRKFNSGGQSMMLRGAVEHLVDLHARGLCFGATDYYRRTGSGSRTRVN